MGLFDFIKTKIDKDPHFTELLSGTSVAFVLRVVGMILSYTFLFAISRFYEAKGVGIFALSLVFLNIGGTIAKGGLNTAFLRFSSEFASNKDFEGLKNVYKRVLILAIPFPIVFSILLFFSSPLIAGLLNKPYISPYFKLMAVGILPFVLFSINAAGLRGLKNIAAYVSLLFLWLNLFSLCFLITLHFSQTKGLFSSLKGFLPEISYILAVLVNMVLSFVLFIKNLKKLEGYNITSNKSLSFGEILNTSLPMLVSNSLMVLIGWIDTIMLGWLGSLSDVGIYNIALRIARLINVFLTSVNTIAAPKFAEFYAKKDFFSIARFGKQASKMAFLLTFPVAAILIIFPKHILSIFGKGFEKGEFALIILVTGLIINVMAGSVGNILQMTGNQKYHRNILIIGTLMNVFLNYLLIPIYGINGAAFSSAVSLVFWNVMFSLKVKKLTGEWVFYPQIKNKEIK